MMSTFPAIPGTGLERYPPRIPDRSSARVRPLGPAEDVVVFLGNASEVDHRVVIGCEPFALLAIDVEQSTPGTRHQISAVRRGRVLPEAAPAEGERRGARPPVEPPGNTSAPSVVSGRSGSRDGAIRWAGVGWRCLPTWE